ncbi:MAG: DUF885 domain-containing protein [Usitatibacter sp.]
MTRFAPAALVAALLFAPAIHAAPAKDPPPNRSLASFFEREFVRGLQESPESATIFGIDGYDDKVTDLSPAAVERRKAGIRKSIAELEKFPAAGLNTQDRISRDMMLFDLKLNNRENEFYKGLPFGAGSGDNWSPVNSMNGPGLFMAFLARATPFRNTRDYENYLKRLDHVPRGLDQITNRMRAGIKAGWVPPAEAMQKVPEMFDVFAGTEVAATPMWKPFESFPEGMPEADRKRLAAAGRKVLTEKVHPAFAALQKFVRDEYIPACSKSLAASNLPPGGAYYALRVLEATTTTMTPAQIHAVGLAEVARIRGEMDKLIAALKFKGSFAEFVEFVRTDKQFFFTRPEDRLMAYRDIAKRADAELPKLFAVLPRIPYGVRAMDAYEGDNSDHYSPPALDGSRAGFFEANVNNLEKRPSHEMEATLLHEAVPGHHLQNARAMELTGLPTFRRSAWYVAYGEGWALYAESLGHEMGFYKDPYQAFGRLSGEMLRACRLVIDTGIHSMGWQREQSIKYLAENSGVHPDYAAAEVDRYIVIPGQALGYKIGELRIKALRAKASASLGDRFDLRAFHNVVLDDGAVPLTVLEARVDEWIAKRKVAKVASVSR